MKRGLCRRREWLLLVLLALVGCGPGVGGTGTGGQSSALELFGAKPASVCSASFARQLKCPTRIVVGPTFVEPVEGTESDVWVDEPQNGQVTARINDSDIEFRAFCDGVRFSGTWGKREDEAVGHFYGYFTAPDLIVSAPGTLSAHAADDGRLAYVLRDGAGQVVFGPRILQKAEGEPASALCEGGQAPVQSGQPGDGASSASRDDSSGRIRTSIRPPLTQ